VGCNLLVYCQDKLVPFLGAGQGVLEDRVFHEGVDIGPSGNDDDGQVFRKGSGTTAFTALKPPTPMVSTRAATPFSRA
jgi:hypothetical protein